MSVKKLSVVLAIMIIASMVLSACATPEPQVVEKVVTSVVEKEVKVIETQVVETVKEVEKQVEVMVTPTPGPAEKVVRVNITSYPDIIDPQKSSFQNEITHLSMIYEGLTTLNAALETVPGAAESWEYNDDSTELTFTLRPDLKYSDGSILNAARFAYAIKRNINPETAGEYAQITDEIVGAPEWRACEGDACEAAAAALDESILPQHADGAACNADAPYEDAECNTLKLVLSKPAPYFHTVMSLWVTYPAKEENITEGGDIWWTSAPFQIGNGPYVLQNIEPFVRAYFTPNENYQGGVGKVAYEFAYITDTAVAFEAYKNNEFDVITLGAEDYPVVMADPVLKEEAKIYPGSCTYAVMFHQLKEPFTDPKIRQAFAQSIDREAWVTDILNGLGAPTLTWIPPGYPGYDEKEARWGYDVEAAKQAIADSTYGSVDALPPITITFSDTPRNRTRWEWMAAKWNEALGVEVALDPVESTTYTALTKDINTAPQAFLLGWCADYPDPQNWLSVYWKTGAFGERIGYSNPELDEMLNAADVESDPDTRMQMYMDAQTFLTDNVPVAFMYNNVNQFLVKPWVTGYETYPQEHGFPGSVEPGAVDIDLSLLPQQ